MKTRIAVFCFLSLSLLGCKKDDSGTQPTQATPPPTELVATWIFQSATVAGSPAPLSDVLNWEAASVSANFTVSPTGGYAYREVDGAGATTFSSSGTITITATGFTIVVNNVGGTPIPPQTLSGTWSLNGSLLSLTASIGGQTVVLVAAKQ